MRVFHAAIVAIGLAAAAPLASCAPEAQFARALTQEEQGREAQAQRERALQTAEVAWRELLLQIESWMGLGLINKADIARHAHALRGVDAALGLARELVRSGLDAQDSLAAAQAAIERVRASLRRDMGLGS